LRRHSKSCFVEDRIRLELCWEKEEENEKKKKTRRKRSRERKKTKKMKKKRRMTKLTMMTKEKTTSTFESCRSLSTSSLKFKFVSSSISDRLVSSRSK
jgi:predicted acyl esterase